MLLFQCKGYSKHQRFWSKSHGKWFPAPRKTFRMLLAFFGKDKLKIRKIMDLIRLRKIRFDENFVQNIAGKHRLSDIGSIQTIHAIGSNDSLLPVFHRITIGLSR